MVLVLWLCLFLYAPISFIKNVCLVDAVVGVARVEEEESVKAEMWRIAMVGMCTVIEYRDQVREANTLLLSAHCRSCP